MLTEWTDEQAREASQRQEGGERVGRLIHEAHKRCGNLAAACWRVMADIRSDAAYSNETRRRLIRQVRAIAG